MKGKISQPGRSMFEIRVYLLVRNPMFGPPGFRIAEEVDKEWRRYEFLRTDGPANYYFPLMMSAERWLADPKHSENYFHAVSAVTHVLLPAVRP